MTNEQSIATLSENRDEKSSIFGLSRQETRQILTPFAFKIDEQLFGTALARPWKRALAILVDLMFIAMLAEMPGEVLAIVIAVTCFNLGSKKRAAQLGKVKGRKRRALMRFIGAFVIFVVLMSTLPHLLNSDQQELADVNDIGANTQVLSNEDAIEFAALAIEVSATVKSSQCQDKACWHDLLLPSIEKASRLSLKQATVSDGLDGIVELTELSSTDSQALKESLLTAFNNKRQQPQSQQDEKSSKTKPTTVNIDVTGLIADKDINVTADKKAATATERDKNIYSIVEFVKGIITDLGLEFGWAAFYFTAFTALWQGQTPGKKLFKIKVLQLDGTPLSISDSFGRYGGYGAGIATGLLGFLQIFWDANRQAIHDKISSTVVIDLTKAKQAFGEGEHNAN